jgi:DNA-binding response OmpR family regulator
VSRILVIEDDRNVRDVVATYLRRVGHDVLEAADGKRALSAIAADDIDLVITDINMPEMDGIEVITALRKSAPGAPVIAMSGGGLVHKQLLLDTARMLGAVHTLAKPFELEDLRKAVDAALGESPKELA